MDEKLVKFCSLGVCGGYIIATQTLEEGEMVARREGRSEHMAHLEKSQRS